jgi:hypothetical protein
VHAHVAPVKKEKDQTLTDLLTACSKAEDHGIDAEMQEQEVPDFNIDRHDVGNQLAVIDYIEDIHTFYQKTEWCVCAGPLEVQADDGDIVSYNKSDRSIPECAKCILQESEAGGCDSMATGCQI